jgi:phosphoserine aminotransferase
LSEVDRRHDVVFTWNGTTSGVRVPDAEWISEKREGVVICDATSAAFAQRLDWKKLDATTFSWQKALGGEAAHGVIVLSPRAVERLESHKPAWPLPKIFRLTKGGKLIDEIFEGATINTPSMLCVEDYVDALKWGASIGGLGALCARADANFAALEEWVEDSRWADFLCAERRYRSNTSVCLKIVDPRVTGLEEDKQRAFVKKMDSVLETEGVGFDVAGHRDAPPGLRIWCGATVDRADVETLTPWLDWAFAQAKAALL